MTRMNATPDLIDDAVARRENPYASRFVRPGAMPYVFPSDMTIARLVDRFDELGRRAAITGPHGSGKSTLLASLTAELAARGNDVVSRALRDGAQGFEPIDFQQLSPRSVLVIDGYEQLSLWRRIAIALGVRRRRAGLIVTTHDAVRLPILYRTTTTPESAVQLALQLAATSTSTEVANPIAPDDVRRLFARHEGNLREVFFSLYDLYESRRS